MPPFSSLLIFLGGCLVTRTDGIPSFVVDLDLHPKQRWQSVAKYYRTELVVMNRELQYILASAIGDAQHEWLKVTKYDAESEAELQGIVEAVNDTAFTLNSSKLHNMLYELESPTQCSGVLWTMPNGTVMQGRNMDYGFHFQMPDGGLRNLPSITFEAQFYKKGKLLMKSTQWPGGIGIHTAMRPGGWSVQQNSRTAKNTWQDNLQAAEEGGLPYGVALRKVMETTPKFEDALAKISATRFMAPHYFVVSGTGPSEGAVLTVDRLGHLEPSTPGIIRLKDTKAGWHLVQTNSDLNQNPLFDARLVFANGILRYTNPDFAGPNHLMQFMHTPRLFNAMTVFSTVMVAATGHYETSLPTEAPGPVTPWEIGVNVPAAGVHGKHRPQQFLARDDADLAAAQWEGLPSTDGAVHLSAAAWEQLLLRDSPIS